MDSTFVLPLKNDEGVTFKSKKSVKPSKSYSDPYWLQKPHSLGLFAVENKDLIGKPENETGGNCPSAFCEPQRKGVDVQR